MEIVDRSPTQLKTFIEGFIVRAVAEAGTRTPYRRPLVAFAAADDPAWVRLRETLVPSHVLPTELLPGARTVVAFFVPFGESVVRANRRAEDTAAEWAEAYRETNALINRITAGLKEALAERGVHTAAEPATHNFDPVTLEARWSHKSAAAIAGLGAFGLHRMLITEAGCAGRCGSLVVDAELQPTPREDRERCLFFREGRCGACAAACPAAALRQGNPGEDNLDKPRCYGRLLEVEARLGTDCCGKCAVGPCALGSP
jgi:epoxyqueuosine reductase QueG